MFLPFEHFLDFVCAKKMLSSQFGFLIAQNSPVSSVLDSRGGQRVTYTVSLKEAFGQTDVPHHKTHSWKYTEFQSQPWPGQQYSLSLAEAKMDEDNSLCLNLVSSSCRGGFHAEMI